MGQLTAKYYLQAYVAPLAEGAAYRARRLAPVLVALWPVFMAARKLSEGAFTIELFLIAALAFFGVAVTGVFKFLTGTAHHLRFLLRSCRL
ncbi:MAG: hypothetical protein MK098_08695 [Marinovum sp.]|nr:hypothetical protein [Marinovum sp.]